jgi:hypothetical protein
MNQLLDFVLSNAPSLVPQPVCGGPQGPDLGEKLILGAWVKEGMCVCVLWWGWQDRNKSAYM